MNDAIREAREDDVRRIAELAEAKREQYRDHASPFQRPALNGRDVHEAFLPKLLEWDGFVVLVHEGVSGVDGAIVARFGSAPPPFGDGSWFHVDDFVVVDPGLWPTVGSALLREVARRATASDLEQAIVVSGPESIDRPKATFLRDQGLVVAAEWQTLPTTPTPGDVPTPLGFEAAVGPAPPVYDPGGLTALALGIDEPAGVARFEEFAAASQAVVAIVPVRTTDSELRAELGRRGYETASEWYAGPSAGLLISG